MPEMRFSVRWPDGSEQLCYSPSLVIRDHFAPGRTYDLPDFLERSRTALTIASDRVRERYGFPCARALGQLADIEQRARRHAGDAHPTVTVTAFHEG